MNRIPPPLTELAEKYTHPTGPLHDAIGFTGKSGLTPVTKEQLEFDENGATRLEKYQRRRFRAFTTRELHDMGVFAPTYESREDTDGMRYVGVDYYAGFDHVLFPLHPLFYQTKWGRGRPKAVPRFSLPGGKSGLWEAGNNQVWKVLRPALCIASQCLISCNSHAWFRALVYGDFAAIEEGIPDIWRGKLVHFSPRTIGPTEDKMEEEETFQRIYDEGLQNITFELCSGSVDQTTGMHRPRFWMGLTEGPNVIRGPRINLAFELLIPLLRNDLTIAERRTDLTAVAIVLIHEICHAIWYNLMSRHGMTSKDPEPYFKGDSISELGFSMHEHVFGGAVRGLVGEYPRGGFGPGRGLSWATLLCFNIMNKDYENYCGLRFGQPLPALKPLPPTWLQLIDWPVPISWTEQLFQPEFWARCVQYPELLLMGPKTIGSKRDIDAVPSALPGTAPLFTRVNYSDYDFSRKGQQPIPGAPTPTKLQAIGAENDRRRHNSMIKDVLNDSTSMQTDPQPSNPVLTALPTPATEPEPVPQCPRYDEIGDFLLANRSQDYLCLDTMTGICPENTLLQHIILFSSDPDMQTQGRSLDITPEEWRAFLQITSSKDDLVSWDPAGRGILRWQRQTFADYPFDGSPSTKASEWFQENGPADPDLLQRFVDVLIMDDARWTTRGFDDYDFEELREERLNAFIRMIDGTDSGNEFSEEQLCACIHTCEVENALFRWGPNGIIRRIDNGWPPADGPGFFTPDPGTPAGSAPMSSPIMVTSQPISPVQPPPSSCGVLLEGGYDVDVDMSDDDDEDFDFMQMSMQSQASNDSENSFGVPKAPRPF